jgi:hypothetical protein
MVSCYADSMSVDHTDLVLASRHVNDGRLVVTRQRRRIERLRMARRSTRDAERTLQFFETSLAIFEEHERQLRLTHRDGSSPSTTGGSQ